MANKKNQTSHKRIDSIRHKKARNLLNSVRPALLEGVTLTPAILELVRVITIPIVESLNDLADQVAELQKKMDEFEPADLEADMDTLIETIGNMEVLKEREKVGDRLN